MKRRKTRPELLESDKLARAKHGSPSNEDLAFLELTLRAMHRPDAECAPWSSQLDAVGASGWEDDDERDAILTEIKASRSRTSDPDRDH